MWGGDSRKEAQGRFCRTYGKEKKREEVGKPPFWQGNRRLLGSKVQVLKKEARKCGVKWNRFSFLRDLSGAKMNWLMDISLPLPVGAYGLNRRFSPFGLEKGNQVCIRIIVPSPRPPHPTPPPTPLFVRWPQQFWGLKAKAQHNRSPDRNRKDLLFKVVPYPSEAIEQMLCLHSHAKCPDWVTSSTLRAVALLWHAVSWRDKGRREWGLGGG